MRRIGWQASSNRRRAPWRCNGILHFEDGVNKEAFHVAVIAAKSKHLADNAAAWLTFNMDDKIDSFCDLGFGIAESALRVTAHHKIGETVKGFLRRVGVDRGH